MAGLKRTWQGDQLTAQAMAAARRAMQATLEDAAAQAQQPGYVPVDTGALKNDIRAGDVDAHGDTLSGWFGAPSVSYALVQEVNEEFTHHNGGPHFLRRAADKVFPTFLARYQEEARR